MNFSFSSIKAALVDRLSLLTGWTRSIVSLSVYSRILDVITYSIEKFTYTLEYYFKQSFLKTAEDIISVVVGAWRLGYQPSRKKGSPGNIKVSGDSTFSATLTTYTGFTTFIPRWTICQDDNQQVSVFTTEDATYYTNTVIANRTLTLNDSPVNLGNSLVGFNVSAHGMPSGQIVSIRGTANYDGDYEIDPATTTNRIVILFPNTYVLEVFDGTEKIYTGHLYIPVKEGTPKSFTYTSAGDINESFTIFSDSADNDEVQVFIVDSGGNILHTVTVTSDIFLINSTTNYYCSIESLPSFKGFTLTFGDGVTSRKLFPGEYVLVKYADTQGSTGGVNTTGFITKFKSSVIDSAGNQTSLFVTNDSVISGGSDYEDIEHIRHYSRNLFYAGNRAHSEDDWVAILESIPQINKAKVWSDYDLNQTTVGQTNSIVHVSAVSNLGASLTVSQQSAIKINYLKKTRSITDIVIFEPLQVVNAQFRISAKLKQVPSGPVVAAIYDNLVAKYGILNTAFSNSIYFSDADTTITSSSSDIIYQHTEVWHVERSESYPAITESIGSHTIVVAFSDSDPTRVVTLSPGKIELWIRRKVAGNWQIPKKIGETGSPSTNFIGTGGYTIVGGVVNYSTSQLTYNVIDIINDIPPDGGSTFGVQNPTDTDDDGYVLRITYQTQDGNGDLTNDIRLPYFYNITDVNVEDVQYFFSFSY